MVPLISSFSSLTETTRVFPFEFHGFGIVMKVELKAWMDWDLAYERAERRELMRDGLGWMAFVKL